MRTLEFYTAFGTASLFALMLACSGGQGNNRETVADSAGIRITTFDPDSGALAIWSVSDTPTLDLGVVEGDSAQEFQYVSASLRLSDGSIVVANAGSSQLRLFDAAGNFVRSAGREGRGPGEFRNIGGLFRYPGDSIAVYDRSLRRLTLFGAQLTSGRQIELASPDGRLSPSIGGVLADGRLLVHAVRPVLADAPGAVLGVHRSHYVAFLYTPLGERSDSLDSVAGDEWVGLEEDGRISLAGRPFYRDGFIVTRGNDVIVADGEVFDLRVYREGRLHQRIRLTQPSLPVTPEDISRYTERMLESFSDDDARATVRSRVERTPFPETFSALVGVYADRERNLWVEQPRRPGQSESRHTVLDSRGRPVARITLPPRLTLHDIGSDYLLGRALDSLNVEHVRMYRLLKGEAPVRR